MCRRRHPRNHRSNPQGLSWRSGGQTPDRPTRRPRTPRGTMSGHRAARGTRGTVRPHGRWVSPRRRGPPEAVGDARNADQPRGPGKGRPRGVIGASVRPQPARPARAAPRRLRWPQHRPHRPGRGAVSGQHARERCPGPHATPQRAPQRCVRRRGRRVWRVGDRSAGRHRIGGPATANRVVVGFGMRDRHTGRRPAVRRSTGAARSTPAAPRTRRSAWLAPGRDTRAANRVAAPPGTGGEPRRPGGRREPARWRSSSVAR